MVTCNEPHVPRFKNNYEYVYVVTTVFAPPIDIQQALVQHTLSVSVPIRHLSGKALSSHKLRDRHTYRSILYTSQTQQKISGTYYAVYSCVWRLWVVFLEHGGGALGIFKSPVCTSNQAWTFFCPLHTIYVVFLSKRSGRRRPPAERSALCLCIHLYIYSVYM